jgi:opacity protein-like surface antigen
MNRTYLYLASAIASILVVPAANAQTYVGVSAGIASANESNNRGTFTSGVAATTTAPIYGAIPSGTPVGWNTTFDLGYNISAQVGHRFKSGFRIEGELAYSRNGVKRHNGLTVGGGDIDGVDASVLTRGAALGATVGKVIDSGIGSQSSFGAFANAYYDFNVGGPFQPYVGGGIGLQQTKFDYRPSNVDVGQGKETNFAWQLMAGATYKIGPKFEVFGQYNYRNNGKTTMALDLLPVDLQAKSRQSLVSFGIRIPLGN